MNTGRIRYECTMEGCFTPSGDKLTPEQNDDFEDIIIVKRETQVVRAVEPRTGSEKWNFSVSTHDVTYKPGKFFVKSVFLSNHVFRKSRL